MLQLKYRSFQLPFRYPFTTHKGTKTHQPTLVVSLGLGSLTGYGEAPAIHYYNVTTEGMVDTLLEKGAAIERYSINGPERFWHFLHHLMPGHHFLTAALDIAGWDLFAKMSRKTVWQLIGADLKNLPASDYTIGVDTAEHMVAHMLAHPAPVYKIKMSTVNDIDSVIALRQHNDVPFRVDANEGWSFEEAKELLPELKRLGVTLVEQPISRIEHEAMRVLKQLSPIPLFADESCRTEDEVRKCADQFHGINIKLTKCGGITPALRMIKEARSLGLKVMLGSMNESSIGTAAIANMVSLADEVDADGPLLLQEDLADGLSYSNGIISLSGAYGLGIQPNKGFPALHSLREEV